jgi:hypothetical protein
VEAGLDVGGDAEDLEGGGRAGAQEDAQRVAEDEAELPWIAEGEVGDGFGGDDGGVGEESGHKAKDRRKGPWRLELGRDAAHGPAQNDP